MNALAMLGAALIGLSLGLTGAGGSIITLPVLVYLAGVAPNEAVGLSLFIVGVAALVGALQRLRGSGIHLKAALMFALSGMIGAAGRQAHPSRFPAGADGHFRRALARGRAEHADR